MKTFTDEAMDAIQLGDAIVGGAVAILSDPPIRLWSGYGILTLDGEDFQPIGDRGLAQATGGTLGSSAQNVTLSLSGIEPEALELLEADEVRGAPVVLYRLIFSGDGLSLLDYHVFQRGRLDLLPIEDEVGGTATIKALVETAARGLGRRGGRMRSDADQRLIDPDDGFFKHAAYAAQKTLYWGGKKPATAGEVFSYGGGNGRLFETTPNLV